MILRGWISKVGLVVLLTITSQGPGDKLQPRINQEFPIRNGNELSPPIVSVVGDCAKAVHVSSFIAHAIVRVFVNGALAGTANPYFADADIPVSRPLNIGDVVTATQEVLGFTSAPSAPPMVVTAYPATLNKPTVVEPLYACGRIVPVDSLNPGTVVDVFRNHAATPIGEDNVTQPWMPVGTASLNQPDQVTAIQTACPSDPSKKKVSPTSAAVPVNTSPNPPSPPTVENYPAGADAVVLDGLFVGADISVTDNHTPVGGGFATANRNRAPVQPPTNSASNIQARQSLCTPSLPSNPLRPSLTLNAPVIVPPLCEGQPYITVANSYPNSIVVLYRNGAIAGMVGGDLGDITIPLGAGATWALGDEAQVLQYVGNIISPRSAPAYANCAKQNVITQHNDNSRSGANLAETVLKPSNVNFSTFGRLFSRQVEGDIVGQPLYVRSVHTTAQGIKNLFFVTTSKNNIYAFDADAPPNSPSVSIWQRNLCGARHLCVDLGKDPSGIDHTDPPNCTPVEICAETRTGFVGITSTPAIDPTTQTMYVVTRCSTQAGMVDDGSVYIYAINLADGSDRVPRVLIQGTAPDNGPSFDFHCQRNRPGLLLSNGIIYVAFATFQCDQNCVNTPYHGWVFGYRESDLAQTAVFVTSPGKGKAGIWQTGNGLAAAADGSIYFETANGPWPYTEALEDSFVKLVPANVPGGFAPHPQSFQPNNALKAPPSSWAGTEIPPRMGLSEGDTDLGSGGPMLLPGGMLIGGGKQGRFYLLDQAAMQLSPTEVRDRSVGFDGFQAFFNSFHSDLNKPACPNYKNGTACDWSEPNLATCYIDPNRYGDGEQCGPNIHGGPVYWQMSPTSGMIYKMPEKDFLKGFHYDLTTKQVTESPALTAAGSYGRPPTDGMPGGFSSISANGMTDGIVWTSLPNGDGQGNLVNGILVAHDAKTLAQLWYDDDPITFAKSVPPTIADGKVFRAVLTNPATPTNVNNVTGVVIVYGLNRRPPRPAPCILCYTIAQKYSNYAGSIGVLGTPTSEEMPVGDNSKGRYRNYRGSIMGMTRTIASVEMSGKGPIPTCSNPKGISTSLDSTIYWNQRTGAHVVMGEIRKLYSKLGGPKGKLGYPIEDETYSPDHYGRISRFEHGEIVWHPDKGTHVVYKESDKIVHQN